MRWIDAINEINSIEPRTVVLLNGDVVSIGGEILDTEIPLEELSQLSYHKHIVDAKINIRYFYYVVTGKPCPL